MNEKVISRVDRKGRFGDVIPHVGMDTVKLGGRSCSQCERLFLRIMESVHTTLLNKKEHH